MSVWRFPLLAFADLVVTATLIVLVFALLTLRAVVRNPVGRGFVFGCVVLALGLAPLGFEAITEREIRLNSAFGVVIDRPPLLLWVPDFFTAGILTLAAVLFPRLSERRHIRWRFAFVTAALAFFALNLINQCSPGWCGWFGFPLPYRWWSDGVIVMNGTNLTAGTLPIAVFINSATFLSVAVVASVTYRRRKP
jgi:hypothetical protein